MLYMPGNVQNALIILLSTQAAEIPQSPTLEQIKLVQITLDFLREDSQKDYLNTEIILRQGKLKSPLGIIFHFLAMQSVIYRVLQLNMLETETHLF